MKLMLVDAIKALQEIAVDEGNLEVLIVTEIDGQIVMQRGFKIDSVVIESDKGRKTVICAFIRDDLEDVAEIGFEVDKEAMDKRKKREGMI